LLGALPFCSNNAAHQPLIRALALVTRDTSRSQRLYPVTEDVPLDGVVRGGIRQLVVRPDARGRERVDRIQALSEQEARDLGQLEDRFSGVLKEVE